MSVFVVYHSDHPDGSCDIRAVCASREVAEAFQALREQTEGGWIEQHDEWCCSVTEYEPVTVKPGDWQGPKRPYDRRGSIVSDERIARLLANLERTNPYRTLREQAS